jgi:glycine reductase
LATSLDADGAIITAVAGGNAHLDVMFAVRECERRGIRSVLSLVEMAGPAGNDPGMVDTVPEADLIISTGNREELISLPAMDSVIGGSALFEGPPEESGGASSAGDLIVPLRAIVAVNNEMGAWKVGAQLS